MSDAFIGEIRLFGFDYAPVYWAYCDGATVPIMQYQGLYSLIGTIYGGDGKQNFKLPNLQSSLPIGINTSNTSPTGISYYTLGATVGVDTVTLSAQQQLPAHTHTLQRLGAKTTAQKSAKAIANTSYVGVLSVPNSYNAPMAVPNTAPNTTLAQNVVAVAGQGAAHDNRQPYLGLNFCICLNGTYPVPAD